MTIQRTRVVGVCEVERRQIQGLRVRCVRVFAHRCIRFKKRTFTYVKAQKLLGPELFTIQQNGLQHAQHHRPLQQ